MNLSSLASRDTFVVKNVLHPQWDQNLQFLPLSEKNGASPRSLRWESPHARQWMHYSQSLCFLLFTVRTYDSLLLIWYSVIGARNVLGEQGWRSGESTRLPPIWPGFESWRRRHMWVEFVVGSLPCSERFFSGHSGFPPLLKNNSIWNARTRFNEFLWTP